MAVSYEAGVRQKKYMKQQDASQTRYMFQIDEEEISRIEAALPEKTKRLLEAKIF